MQRCTQCIIPGSAHGITFDAQGRCQLCRDYQPVPPLGLAALAEQLESCANMSGSPNCVVPVSGGRDSAFALWYAKQVLGLRPLAVHNDNGFQSAAAARNLAAMTRALDVPLIISAGAQHLARRVVAEKFRMNAPFGPGLIVEQTCEACKYGFESAASRAARENNIGVILWGDSQAESTNSYHALVEHRRPRVLQKLVSRGLSSRIRYKYLYRRFQRACGPIIFTGIRQLHLFDYIEWDRVRITTTIQGQLGWTRPAEAPTSWRIDCTLVPLVSWLTRRAWGVSKFELGFSNFIRSGKMARREALAEAEALEETMRDEQIARFLDDLGIPGRTIRAIM